jgi:hypothetical protein
MTIEAYIGLPGMGKTYLMTRLGLKHMKQGIPVYANYPLEGAIRYHKIEELFDIKEATILMDEAGLIAPSAHWNRIPFEVMAHWRQHRHKKINLWYTAQDLHDIAVPLRRVTQYVNDVKKLGPFIWWKCFNPRTKEKYGGGFTMLDETVYKKYDTHAENVTKQDYLNGL